MGCRQVRVKPPPDTAKSASSAPAYVKSALKDSKSRRGGKTKKLSLLHRKQLAPNKSVNFDERVRIKSRTPTPKTSLYEKQPSSKASRGSTPTDDDATSISSEDGSSIEQASESSSSLSSRSPSKSSKQKTMPRNAVSPAATTPHQTSQPSMTHPQLIEHRLPLANGGSSAQTTYYEFSRRQGDQLKPSYTKRTTN